MPGSAQVPGGSDAGESQMSVAAVGDMSATKTNYDNNPVDAAPQLTKEESFRKVTTTDAEGAVHHFAQAPLFDKLRRVFDTFDIDKNGSISIEEVLTMVRTLHVNIPEDKVIQMMKDADLDDNGEVDFDEFTRAMQDQDFLEMVTIASFPAEIYKILEDGNMRFLSTFKEYVVVSMPIQVAVSSLFFLTSPPFERLCGQDIMDRCQQQVLAAQVPLASFGRIHTALTEVKSTLEGTAHDILSVELTHLRTGALESLKAQREAIETRNKAHLVSAAARIRAEAAAKAAEVQAKYDEAEAEANRLHDLFKEPEAIILRLQAELKEANERRSRLEVQVRAYEDDWHALYPQALAASSVVPPPLPADAPYIVRALEQQRMTLRGLVATQLSPDANEMVTKTSVREVMVRLDLVDAKYAAEPKPEGAAGSGTSHSDDAFLKNLYARPGPSVALEELVALWLEWEGPPNRQSKPAGKSGKHPKASRAAKPKEDSQPSSAPSLVVENALQRALDRNFAEEAHGARLLYFVELYEKAMGEKDAKHAEELRRAYDKVETQSSTAAEAEAERSREWEKERELVASANAAQLREMEAQLKAEKAVRQDEIAQLHQSAEQAQTAALSGERAKVDELRAQLKRKSEECQQLSEQLSTTTAELQETKADRENKSFLVKKTQHNQEAEHDAYEAKLQKASAALKKAESAQPTQGGYYFAAARAPSMRPSSPPSKHSSPEGLFDKTRRLSGDASTLFDKAARSSVQATSEVSPSPPETERSDATAQMKSSKGSRQGRGKAGKNKSAK